MSNTKKCSLCEIEKDLSHFYYIKATGRFTAECKECKSIRGKKYYEENKIVRLEYSNDYYQENKNDVLSYRKKYREDNPEITKAVSKKYRANHPDKIKSEQKQYREAHKEELNLYCKQYRKENLVSLKEKRRIYEANKLKIDITYRLRKIISRAVNIRLMQNNATKAGKSILKFLPYTIEQLKEHLENQFEYWMNWDNRGSHITGKWDENDPTTWVWQLDHIIPQSDLPYSSMEDENFEKCWALENLRPLSAKQNHEDGIKRTRHNIRRKNG